MKLLIERTHIDILAFSSGNFTILSIDIQNGQQCFTNEFSFIFF